MSKTPLGIALANLKPKRPKRGSLRKILDEDAASILAKIEEGATFAEIAATVREAGHACSEHTVRSWNRDQRRLRKGTSTAASKVDAPKQTKPIVAPPPKDYTETAGQKAPFKKRENPL